MGYIRGSKSVDGCWAATATAAEVEATRYARNALLLSRASREWRRIAINFLSFFFSRAHRSPSASPGLPFYPRSTQFRSFWFRSELIRACAAPCCAVFRSSVGPSVRPSLRSFFRSSVRLFVRSSAHSFRMAGWRYPVQPEFASRIPLFAFQFCETLAAATIAAAAAKRRAQT